MKSEWGIKEGFLKEMPPKLNFDERTGIRPGMYIRNSMLQAERAVYGAPGWHSR